MNPLLKQAFDHDNKCSKLRDDAGLELWSTPLGDLWVPQDDNSFASTINETAFYGEVSPGEVVMDCGANIGIVAKTFLDAGVAKLVAIEPYYPNFRALYRNLKSYNNAFILENGLWNDDREAIMSVHDLNFSSNSVVFHRGAKSTGVKLTTLDKIVSSMGLNRVDFIKMDIEGAEIPALEGAKETISKFKPHLAVAAEHFVTDLQSIPQKIKEICSEYEFTCSKNLIIYARIPKS